MAKRKSKDLSSSPTPPSLPPNKALSLLKRQKEKAETLLQQDQLSHEDDSSWKNTTREILIHAFGSDSKNVYAVLFASSGHSHVYLERPPEHVLEKHRRDDLEASIKMLDSCIEQLEILIPEKEREDKNMSSYDVAQICMNGHVVNSTAIDFPEFSEDYCKKCGAKTIKECQNCQCAIRGRLRGTLPSREFSVSAYCHNCGKPFPWTEAKLQAAKELAEELEGLNEEEKEIFSKSLDDIVVDTPRTELGVARIKKFMKKATGDAVQTMRSLIVDIASETAVKLLKQ